MYGFIESLSTAGKERLMQSGREIRRSGTLVRKTGFFLVALLASVIFVTGCGGDEQAQEDPAEEQSTPAQTTEQAEQTTNAERTEDTAMDKGTASEGSGQEVTLKIEGDPGTEFSGVCNVGGQEKELAGETPQSLVYDLPEGQKLDCEIRKSGADSGSLKVTLTVPGNNIVQTTNAPGGSLNLSFSESGVTSSSSSASSSSSSIVQQSSSSGNSSSIVQQSSSSVNSSASSR